MKKLIVLISILLASIVSAADYNSAFTGAQIDAKLTGVPTANVINIPCTGTEATDKSAINAALAALYTAGGGTMVISGNCRYDSQLVLPNDAGAIFAQPSLRITGNGGGDTDGRWGVTTATPTSSLDLRYATGAVGKIVTLGVGYLEIDHITLMDGGSANNVPFILTTNTTINIHDMTFSGSGTEDGTSNDGIIFGAAGSNETVSNAVTGPFQGYVSRVERCWFDKLRKVAVYNTFANGIIFNYNTISSTCRYTAGGAITLAGFSASVVNSGNIFIGNLFELHYLKYAFNLGNAAGNTFIGNGIYDGSAISGQAVVNFGAGSDKNLFIPGFYAITLTAGTLNSNQLFVDMIEPSHRFYSGAVTTPFADCSAAIRGVTYYFKGGTGIADLKATCVKDVNDKYHWKPVMAVYLGADAVTNGTFDTDASWTKGAGWLIDDANSNVASHTAGNATGMYQAIAAATAGTMWQCTYTVTRTAGSVQLIFGAWSNYARALSGTYTETFVAPIGTDTLLYFNADADFVGTIDNVIVKQIIPY